MRLSVQDMLVRPVVGLGLGRGEGEGGFTQPGRRKRFVKPSMIKTSSSSTSMMLSAAETTLPSQLEP